MRNLYPAVLGTILLFSCASTFTDKVYVIDAPNNNLRAPDPKDDRLMSDCDPKALPSGKIEYKCVAHFLSDYQALLNKIAELQSQLDSCQNSK